MAPGALYLQVARTLQDKIATGTLPVGCLLPTEHELAEQFGVSRQTIRQAILHLRGMKLLSARKGVGTRVESSRPQTAYYHALQSLSDLFQFASDALYRVTQVDRITAAGKPKNSAAAPAAPGSGSKACAKSPAKMPRSAKPSS